MDRDTQISAEQAALLRDTYARWGIAGVTHVGVLGERLVMAWLQDSAERNSEATRAMGAQVLDVVEDYLAVADAILRTHERARETFECLMRNVEAKMKYLGAS